MRETFEIIAEKRNDAGKGASRRLRRANKVPAILYGAAQPPQPLAVDHNALSVHLEHEAFYSHILTLKVDGSEEKVVLRDLQRHPSKPRILHMDLQRVSATEKLRMRVPLHFVGADVAPGVKQSGGIVSHLLNDVEVSCLAADLPEYVEADLTNLKLGETIHLSDLKLPAGVELVALMGHRDAEHDRPVATIHLPRAAVEEEAKPAAEGEVPATEQAAAEAKPEAKGKGEGKS
ncbi:MAG: 50S ribosomal protein L25/general stress protein Ctc [Pseudomonadota bacterium]